MKTTKWLAVTLAAALGVGGVFVMTASAAPRAVGQRQARARVLVRVKEKLRLTDDQVARIRAELGAEKDTLKSLATRMHDARVGLREAIQASDATEASVRAAAAKVGTVQADLAVERFKLHGRIAPILTDEQKEKVKQFQAQIDEFVEGAINRLGDRLGSN